MPPEDQIAKPASGVKQAVTIAIVIAFICTLAISIWFKAILGQGLNLGISIVGLEQRKCKVLKAFFKCSEREVALNQWLGRRAARRHYISGNGWIRSRHVAASGAKPTRLGCSRRMPGTCGILTQSLLYRDFPPVYDLFVHYRLDMNHDRHDWDMISPNE